ncbi:MAG: hypothetical protein ACJAUG_001647 [Halioglobus sp.]|jgi:hypothetical protein
MHVSPVLLDGPRKDSNTGLQLDSIQQALTAKLSHSPILTQKLLSLTLGMAEPYWVVDKKFSVDNHLSECQLPSHGIFKATV